MFLALPKSSGGWWPIALLSNVCKFLVRVVLHRLKQHLVAPTNQFAAYGGTNAALNLLQQYIRRHESHALPVYAVFLDVSKAFDRVHVPSLFHLLRDQIPMYLLRWITNFLSNRTGSLGDAKVEIANRVPQGSVLGPFLFQHYVKNILSGLPNHMHAAAYADDFVIASAGRSIDII